MTNENDKGQRRPANSKQAAKLKLSLPFQTQLLEAPPLARRWRGNVTPPLRRGLQAPPTTHACGVVRGDGSPTHIRMRRNCELGAGRAEQLACRVPQGRAQLGPANERPLRATHFAP
eukprot:CAMPEP_0119517392 /NCGR_PEP_ID=MMETSP1344-20130328/34305_1 /TAXON_ID=236787 /ORGANISM="Florenciella parvula, Strain CCMP2471" /LENGTH=116 /DNA_ID=CAMNT_0007554981 /DNA_START=339 /DNA_END=686 /DNA_ORIENTATION=+